MAKVDKVSVRRETTFEQRKAFPIQHEGHRLKQVSNSDRNRYFMKLSEQSSVFLSGSDGGKDGCFNKPTDGFEYRKYNEKILSYKHVYNPETDKRRTLYFKNDKNCMGKADYEDPYYGHPDLTRISRE